MLNIFCMMYYFVGVLLCALHVYVDSLAVDDIDRHPSWKYFDTEQCGITKYDDVQPRIVNGKKAKLGEFPWIVRLGIKFSDADYIFFSCAGNLINRHYILTAGHCLESNTIARIGENNSRNTTDCDESGCAPPVQDIGIKKIIAFGYQKKTRRRDFQLVLLEKPVQFNGNS
ncbi:unnamed protein product [Acanthoscelides obtectus]|uniref:Peptidase S1 domain-containing protein n=1 Tax=Acanthoscelides obtectus TaxID=200917 RepID=A0A9P0KUU2_ACAOB|nr:unnamed protein product [Acanthoscelides obtectus]CAK1643989.1 hypothetical protein AOBTE_LOCUS13768 [Acanthoscelides obtectus]